MYWDNLTVFLFQSDRCTEAAWLTIDLLELNDEEIFSTWDIWDIQEQIYFIENFIILK